MMKPTNEFLERHRIITGPLASDSSYGNNGAFRFAIPGEARPIHVIASNGLGWEHVSVSFGPESRKTPSWELMCQIKDLFWNTEEAVIQIHPPRSDYVNNHPGCLHLWRCIDGQEQPLPPSIMVGLTAVS